MSVSQKKFEYIGYDKSGGRVQGAIDASSVPDAIQLLQQQSIAPSKVLEIKEKSGTALFSSNKVTLADLEFLTSELSLLLSSGVRIDKGLDIIRRSTAQPGLATMLSRITSSLASGKSLSASMAEFEDVFGRLYINLIELGEASGQLATIFNKLAEDLKFRRDLQRKIISSLTYPAVILAVCVLCIVFIFNFIVPRLTVLFTDPDVLPWYTKALLGISSFFQQYQLLILIGIVGAIAALYKGLQNPAFTKKFQQGLLALPGLKSPILTTERIRLNSALAMMLEAGVPIDKALKLGRGNIKNQLLQREVDIACQKVKHGTSLSEALRQTSLYPDFLVSLLEVGEASGNLARVFDEIAKRSREQFESWTSKMTTLIEPLLILFMGGIVGGVVVVMLMSMVAVNDVGF